MFARLWWNFKTLIKTSWGTYMGNKYYEKKHPVMAMRTRSHIWRSMLAIRDEVEPFIWWKVKEGNFSFWFDNWTMLGALYYTKGDQAVEEEVEVKDFMTDEDNSWKIGMLEDAVSSDMLDIIANSIKPHTRVGIDKPLFKGSTIGNFTTKSAYQIIRHKRSKLGWHRHL